MTTLLPPLLMMLLRWTLLFSLAWAVNLLLRRRHARARQILWRGVLLAAIAIAFLPLLPMPLLQIAIGRSPRQAGNWLPRTVDPALAATPSTALTQGGAPASPVAAASRAATADPVRSAPRLSSPFTLGQALLILWATGAALGIFRLVVLYVRLRGLRTNSLPADAGLAAHLSAAQVAMRSRRPISLRVSPRIFSPFLCGIRRPMLLIPTGLAADLPADHRAALFAHEIAHLQRRDIAWCAAFRCMLALLWFHPLTWKTPAAHELACEQEADRLAASRVEAFGAYARVLAQLALRVLGEPPVEFRLALSATSQIARRLESLNRPQPNPWTRRSACGAGALALALFLLAGGCELTTRKAVDIHAPIEFKKVLVDVKDESGRPIDGAVVTPTGFRVKGIHSADAYGWVKERFGPPVPATADGTGRAWVSYPVMGVPEEQELTGELIIQVDHPGFCTTDLQDYKVDAPNDPVVMKRSGTLDVQASIGGKSVTDLVATLSGSQKRDWEKGAQGHLGNSRIEPGEHILQLMGRLDSGEIVFSAAKVVQVEREKTASERIEMVPGIRVEGHIDAAIPRPIVNGRVFISIRPPQFAVRPIVQDYYAQQDKYGHMDFWHTWRPINADGTFVFESVPPGEADMAAVGDGLVSRSEGEFRNLMPDGTLERENASEHGFVIPQSFALAAPRTTITLLAEPSATVQVAVKTRSGKPVENVEVYCNPNIVRMSGSGLFGIMRTSSESPYKTLDPLPLDVYTAKTDKDGKATLRNLPSAGGSLFLEHPDYQLELQDPSGRRNRIVKLKLSPGVTKTADLTVESKGFSFIGLR